jgi:NitT/TauT family transport system substrate-binding protein
MAELSTISRRHYLKTMAAAGVGALAAPAILSPAAAQGLTTIKVGRAGGVVSDAVFFIADEKGYFKDQGIAIEFVTFDGGPKIIAPLGAGQLDIGVGASSAGLFNAVKRGINIKITADKGSSPPGYAYMPLLVRKDLIDSGQVKSFADLKGLKIAEAAPGGSPGATLNAALQKGGLTYKDVSHVYMGYPQHVPALANKAIDGCILPEPGATMAVERGYAVRYWNDELYPNQQIAVLLYGDDFITKKADLGRRFMLAYVKAAHFYNDALKDSRFAGPNGPEVVRILGEDMKVDDKGIFSRIVPTGINPNGGVNVASLKKDAAFYREQGFLDFDPNVESVIDGSFVEAALKQIGPYKGQRT